MVRQTLFWIGLAVVTFAAYVCIRLANVFDPRILISLIACVPALLVVMLTITRRIGEDEFLVVSAKEGTMVVSQSGWPCIPPFGDFTKVRKPKAQTLTLERLDAFNVSDGSKILLTGPVCVRVGSLPQQLLAFADLQTSQGPHPLSDADLVSHVLERLRTALRALPAGRTSLRDVRLCVADYSERLAYTEGIVADIDIRNVELQNVASV